MSRKSLKTRLFSAVLLVVFCLSSVMISSEAPVGYSNAKVSDWYANSGATVSINADGKYVVNTVGFAQATLLIPFDFSQPNWIDVSVTSHTGYESGPWYSISLTDKSLDQGDLTSDAVGGIKTSFVGGTDIDGNGVGCPQFGIDQDGGAFSVFSDLCSPLSPDYMYTLTGHHTFAFNPDVDGNFSIRADGLTVKPDNLTVKASSFVDNKGYISIAANGDYEFVFNQMTGLSPIVIPVADPPVGYTNAQLADWYASAGTTVSIDENGKYCVQTNGFTRASLLLPYDFTQANWIDVSVISHTGYEAGPWYSISLTDKPLDQGDLTSAEIGGIKTSFVGGTDIDGNGIGSPQFGINKDGGAWDPLSNLCAPLSDASMYTLTGHHSLAFNSDIDGNFTIRADGVTTTPENLTVKESSFSYQRGYISIEANGNYEFKFNQISGLSPIIIPKKEITGFNFTNSFGIINGNNINLNVPYNTDIKNMISNFTTNGESINISGVNQVSGTTVNDFTNPVTYTVMATDGTSADYTVTVTVSEDKTEKTGLFQKLDGLTMLDRYPNPVTKITLTQETDGVRVKIALKTGETGDAHGFVCLNVPVDIANANIEYEMVETSAMQWYTVSLLQYDFAIDGSFFAGSNKGLDLMLFGNTTSKLIVPKNGYWQGEDSDKVAFSSNLEMLNTIGSHRVEFGTQEDKFTLKMDGVNKDINQTGKEFAVPTSDFVDGKGSIIIGTYGASEFIIKNVNLPDLIVPSQSQSGADNLVVNPNIPAETINEFTLSDGANYISNPSAESGKVVSFVPGGKATFEYIAATAGWVRIEIKYTGARTDKLYFNVGDKYYTVDTLGTELNEFKTATLFIKLAEENNTINIQSENQSVEIDMLTLSVLMAPATSVSDSGDNSNSNSNSNSDSNSNSENNNPNTTDNNILYVILLLLLFSGAATKLTVRKRNN